MFEWAWLFVSGVYPIQSWAGLLFVIWLIAIIKTGRVRFPQEQLETIGRQWKAGIQHLLCSCRNSPKHLGRKEKRLGIGNNNVSNGSNNTLDQAYKFDILKKTQEQKNS